MFLNEMLDNMRVELQDKDEAIWQGDDLPRAVMKTISLMSRLIPKRDIIETTLVRTITGETLTIASSTGTLAYKPIKVGSVAMSDKTMDTDFRVNYLTGVVTEIGSNLPDTDYTVSYELDLTMLDISSILTDYIKIERLEYPIGTLVTADVWGDFLVFKSNISLTEDYHLRIVYLGKWTAPTEDADGDYPSNLDNAVIIGSVGQALIFKAETYVQSAASALSALTPPSAYTVSKPTAPSIGSPPSAPSAPSLDYTEAEAALVLSASSLVTALGYLTSGTAFLNTATRGETVGKLYGDYGDVGVRAAAGSAAEALAYIERARNNVAKYSGEVAAFGSSTYGYASEVTAKVSSFRGESEAETLGVNNYAAQVNKYVAEVQEQEMKARNFLTIAGRYLASGQAKINEMLVMLGLRTEFPMYKASSEQRD